MATATVASPALAPAPAPTRSSSSSPWDSEIHKSALAHDLERCKWLVTLEPTLLEARGFNGCVAFFLLHPDLALIQSKLTTPTSQPTNKTNNNRVLPAHCAARKGALSVLRFLASRGAGLGGRDHGGWSCLHHASAGGHTNVMAALLLDGLGGLGMGGMPNPSPASSPLDVDVRAGDGSTPLLIAVVEGHREAVRFLLRCGADPGAANAKGVSPQSHTASFLASLAAKAHLFEPVGRIRKSKTTRDREAIGALVHSDLYRAAVLRRLRGAAQAQDGQEGQAQGREMGVLTSLMVLCNDDVFAEALRYLKGDPEGDEA